jgi:hypothetical protein
VVTFAVPVETLVSTTLENVTPAAVVVRVTVPPSYAKSPEALPNATVAVPPAPIDVGVVANVERVVAPALDATANGKAAAINTAPAARAFTMWRGISRKVFTRNPSFVVFIIFTPFVGAGVCQPLLRCFGTA